MDNDSIQEKSTYLGYDLADVIRSILRASISYEEISNQQFAAEDKVQSFLQKIVKMEKVYLKPLIQAAINDLTVKENSWENRELEDFYISVAKKGMKYLIEKSCGDRAAVGRAAKGYDNFERAIERLDQRIDSFFNRKD